MCPAPVIATLRLRLRPHRMSDLPAFAAFFASPRSRWITGPSDPDQMHRVLAADNGSWERMGIGGWAVETQEGQFVGQVAITHPPCWPERNIGWLLFDGCEGRGYATEASRAALGWAWAAGMATLVSYIDPENDRSVAVADRLGATRDDQAALPEGDAPGQTLVYRHRPVMSGGLEACA